MQKLAVFLFIFFLVGVSSSLTQQERKANEPEIPELEEMHHFIRPMWHDAYPAKDTKQLKELYPKLQAQYLLLKNAEFPEQWEDKRMHWQEGIVQIGKTLEEYKLAIDNNEDESLLNIARKLHDDFEKLVKIVNPPIPELDDFHKTLYYVYHDYLPEKKWDMLKAAIPEFEKKVNALQDANLPRWMKNNEDSFKAAVNQLQGAVEKLSQLKDSEDEAALQAAVEAVHEAYVNFEQCMD